MIPYICPCLLILVCVVRAAIAPLKSVIGGTESTYNVLSVAMMNGENWERDTDLNTFREYGIVRHFAQRCTGAPAEFVNVFNIGVYTGDQSNEVMQVAFACNARHLYVRFYHPTNSWGNWNTII